MTEDRGVAFCKDCKYFNNMMCSAPENTLSLVTGEPKAIHTDYNRLTLCGSEALFFKPKESKQKRSVYVIIKTYISLILILYLFYETFSRFTL